MKNDPIYTIPIVVDADVGSAREAATALARDMGFDDVAVGEITLATSEICQNAKTHGGGGIAHFFSLNNNTVLKIIISDQGKGIENIALAMREGFSTIRTSLGIGLEAAQRLTDRFEIQSNVENGTTVVLEKYLPMTTDVIEYGVVSVPDQQYNFNGDEFFIKEFDGDKVLMGVIDGLGQGYFAYAISTLIKNFIIDNATLSLESLVLSCHELLKESDIEGGATISLALLTNKHLFYLGVGDTHAYLIDETKTRELPNFVGRVGEYQLPDIKAYEFPIHNDLFLVLCTDGISSEITYLELNPKNNAQQLANQVFNTYHKVYGDVTVLVTKIKSLV